MKALGVDLDTENWPTPSEAAEARRAIVSDLRPQACPFPLLRIGGDGDGAYLVPDDLEGVKACFSPGVANTKTFEDELLDRFGIDSHLCDKSSDEEKLSTPMVPGRQTFRKVWLGPQDGPDTTSLDTWVNQICPDDSDLVLQMDIEGAEYAAILAASPETLRRFRLIVMELHTLEALNYPRTVVQILRNFFAALTRDHVCVHLHPNNCTGQIQVEDTPYRVPRTLEITLLRRDRITGHPQERVIAPQLPHPKDILCNIPSKAPVFMDTNWTEGSKVLSTETVKPLSEVDLH